MRVAVIGLGVGYALACCLSEAGYNTVGIDVNPDIVTNPREDASVSRLMKNRRARKRILQQLTLTTNYSSVQACSFIVVCVSTGDAKELILGHVTECVLQVLKELRASKTKRLPIIMVYSTLPFGSSKRIREIFAREKIEMDKQVGYVHFPLMIAQGTTAEDFVNPPFVVFGSYTKRIAKRASRFYQQFISRSCLYSGKLPPMFVGTPEEAELAKLSANAYLTTKIALANEIGSLCEGLNVDGQKIMGIVGSDWRIVKKFTRPGYAVGGQCFPRDLKSLIETYHQSNVNPHILTAVDSSNEERVLAPIGKIEGHRILVLGTSYKEGVRDERGSQVSKLIAHLRTKGYSVIALDPKSSKPETIRDGLSKNETVLVTIPEKSFRELGTTLGAQTKVVLDFANIINPRVLPVNTRLWKAGRGWIKREIC